MEISQPANIQIQKINRTSVYQLLRKEGDLTKKAIVNKLNLSLPTVTQNITNLLDDGLIIETDFQSHTGGRRAQRYAINKNAQFAIGLDITKNHIIAVIINMTGEIVSRIKTKEPFRIDDYYLKMLSDIVENVVLNANINTNKILGIGIGIPALVNKNHDTMFFDEILNFKGINIKQFSKFISFPTKFYNDANSAAFAEFWVRDSLKNAFYIMLSANTGGSLIIDGKVFEGKHRHAGEVGHLSLDPKGKECYCGQKGCADRYISATVLSSPYDGDLEMFFSKLQGNDKKAIELWDEYLNNLARTIINVLNILDTDIIIGGYVGGYLDNYIDVLREKVAKYDIFEKDHMHIESCLYKSDSIAAGAALNYISDFISKI